MAQAYTTCTIGTNEWMNGDQGRRAEQSWLFPNELPARNLAVDNDTRLLRITSQRTGGSVAGREVGDTHTGCPSENHYFTKCSRALTSQPEVNIKLKPEEVCGGILLLISHVT